MPVFSRSTRRLTDKTLYYNGSLISDRHRKARAAMPPDSRRSLSSPAAEAGRPAVVAVRPSVLRLGLGARLAGAAAFVAGIWALIGWVLR